MKKVLVILTILILIANVAFAADSVKIKTVVENENPSFILKAGLSPDAFDDVVSADDSAGTLDWETVEKSIKEENIVVFFQIVQKGIARRDGKEFALSIETSEMVLGLNEDGSALAPDTKVYKTTKGKISDINPNNDENSRIGVTLSETAAKDSISLLAEYKGKVDDGTPIATFTVTWAKDINAPDGIYNASVILRVSPQ